MNQHKILTLVFVVIVGCFVIDKQAVALPEDLPIIGGAEDTHHDAVASLSLFCLNSTDSGETFPGICSCTGTLIAPRVILTAAHCVDSAIDNNERSSGSASFNTSSGVVNVPISNMIAHRKYQTEGLGLSYGLPYDIALIRLSRPVPDHIVPMKVNDKPLLDEWIGQSVLTVGYGFDDQGNSGTRRQGELTITSLTNHALIVGDSIVNICQGDSGGPGILFIDDEEQIVGINSNGEKGCRGESNQSRVDTSIDFINEVFDAWSGTCQEDSQCVTDCPRNPDPDCEGACGLNNFCETNCSKRDLDCPVGAAHGRACSDNDDCESQLCVTDSTGDNVCSSTCRLLSDCEAPLSVCKIDAGMDSGVCNTPQGRDSDNDDDSGCTVNGHPSGILIALGSFLLYRRYRKCFAVQ